VRGRAFYVTAVTEGHEDVASFSDSRGYQVCVVLID